MRSEGLFIEILVFRRPIGNPQEDRLLQGQRHLSLHGCIHGGASGWLPMGPIYATFLLDPAQACLIGMW